jgi:glycosyltransferase involved in cell wall biosynthesis
MSSAADLTLGFSSLVERVPAIRVPLEATGVEVLVITQRRSDSPAHAALAAGLDARLIELDSVGVAKSRNAAIDNASRPYLLFADDDIVINIAGVLAAIDHLIAADAAVALCRAVDESGELRKNYPDGVRPLTMTNSGKAATYEMIIDVAKVRAAGVRFDERFGAGAVNYLGDEYIFIADSLRAGLTGLSLPCIVATHPTESSGSRWSTGKDLEARGKAIERAWNRRATLVKAAFAWRNRRQFDGWGDRVRFVTRRHFVEN